MPFPLNKPTIGSTNWGSSVNTNWTTIDNEVERVSRKDAANGYVGINVSGDVSIAGTLTAREIVLTNDTFYQAIRFPLGCTANGAVHELSIADGSGSDSTRFGQSSSTYTTGGAIGWILNDMGYIYFNSSKKFRIGSSVSADTYTEFTNSAINVGPSIAMNVLSATQSTSTSTGALTVAGGMGVAKNICLDGDSGKSLRLTNPVANGTQATTLGSAGPTGSTAGDPQGWVRINVGGTDRYMPFW